MLVADAVGLLLGLLFIVVGGFGWCVCALCWLARCSVVAADALLVADAGVVVGSRCL
jgi:hypothetical protein